VTKLKYNSKVIIGATRDLKKVFIYNYYKTKEFRYILKANTETVIENELVVGIKTLLDIIFIAL